MSSGRVHLFTFLADIGCSPPRYCENARSSSLDVVHCVTRDAFFSNGPVDFGLGDFGVVAIGELAGGLDTEARAVIHRVFWIIIYQHKLVFSFKVEVAYGVDGNESCAHHDILLALRDEVSKKASVARTFSQHGVDVVSNSMLFTEPVADIVGTHGQQLSHFGVAEVFGRDTPVVTVGANAYGVFGGPAHIVGHVAGSDSPLRVRSRALGELPKSHRTGTTAHLPAVVVQTSRAVLVSDLDIVGVLVTAEALGLSNNAHVSETSRLALEEALSGLPRENLVL